MRAEVDGSAFFAGVGVVVAVVDVDDDAAGVSLAGAAGLVAALFFLRVMLLIRAVWCVKQVLTEFNKFGWICMQPWRGYFPIVTVTVFTPIEISSQSKLERIFESVLY
jgi:hypothetical protein